MWVVWEAKCNSIILIRIWLSVYLIHSDEVSFIFLFIFSIFNCKKWKENVQIVLETTNKKKYVFLLHNSALFARGNCYSQVFCLSFQERKEKCVYKSINIYPPPPDTQPLWNKVGPSCIHTSLLCLFRFLNLVFFWKLSLRKCLYSDV